MYRDEHDIQILCGQATREPYLKPYAEFLLAWVDMVNRHSDGWAYWKAGRDAGLKLAEVLADLLKNGKETLWATKVPDARLNQAIGGIKRVAALQKRHGNTIPVPTLGAC